jgi:hypothetical protein
MFLPIKSPLSHFHALPSKERADCRRDGIHVNAQCLFFAGCLPWTTTGQGWEGDKTGVSNVCGSEGLLEIFLDLLELAI